MEREYKITKLEKNKQKLQEDNVAISKMLILTSALVTIMNYANLGFSMGNIREFVISLLSIGIVGVTLGSILYLVKALSEMSDVKFNIEKLNTDLRLLEINDEEEAKSYLITKKVGYSKNIEDRKEIAIKSGLLAIALHLITRLLVIPFGETLDYGSVEKYLVGIVTAFGNAGKYISLSSMIICLLDRANLKELSEKIDRTLKSMDLEERGESR